ncbi:MAG: crossover junction endodeoxyribonuclease RuvC [Gammaproteobacteria bacterium]|nr:crossover junction endodeoxyribonuclease RuvC [Gammaproteobacteria bacterium]
MRRGRVLGLDPGSRRTGFGLLDWEGPDCRHVAHGCIDVASEPFAQRLRRIFEAVSEVIACHRPDEIAIERVFVDRNADSAIKLGQARGAAICAVTPGIAVFEYAPRAVKLAVVGAGGAEKSQVNHMVRELLGVRTVLAADAADALAVALCHAHTRRLQDLAARRPA